MFLNDPLDHVDGHIPIPGPFRIYDRDGTLLTDSKAVRLGAEDAPLTWRDLISLETGLAAPLRRSRSQTQFLEAGFQVLPNLRSFLVRRTLGGLLFGAKEDVPCAPADREGVGNRLQALSGIHSLHGNGAGVLRDRR